MLSRPFLLPECLKMMTLAMQMLSYCLQKRLCLMPIAEINLIG